MAGEVEADEYVALSRHLLGLGRGRLANLASETAVLLHSCTSTTRNRDFILATTTSWESSSQRTMAPVSPILFCRVHARFGMLKAKKAVTSIHPAYRMRIAASLFMVGCVFIIRTLYGKPIPLGWMLLTGIQYSNGNFHFYMSPTVWWLLIAAMVRFFFKRPDTRQFHRHAS